MKSTLSFIIFCISLAFGPFFVTPAQFEEKTSDGFRTVTDGIFSFSVPSSWRAMTDRELNVFKQQYEQQSSELFKQYHGRSEGYESGVPFIVGFFSPRQEVTFVLLVMKIPAQTKGYLQQMYVRSKDVIEWGKTQGRVRQSFRNELTNVNGVPALETDLEMGNGSRMAGYSIYSGDHPDEAIQVTLLFDPGTYSKHSTERSRILSSLQINYKK